MKININDKKSYYNNNMSLTDFYYTRFGKGLIVSELIEIEQGFFNRIFTGFKLVIKYLIK